MAMGPLRGRVRLAALLACALLLSPLLAPSGSAATLDLGDPVVMRAAAVSDSADGFVGSTATITITAATNGSGHIFLDTFPLTAVDMQGSARLAARVASQISGTSLSDHDFFFVIRSGSEQIGGPSAGADMTVGAIAALNGWKVRPDVLMTGTIEPDGSVGPVGGIPEKAAAAAQTGVTTFLFPAGEEITTLSATRQDVNLTTYCAEQLKITCVPVSDVVQAVNVMTDHQIVVPPVAGNVTGEAYLARLAPLSADLVNASEALLVQASAGVAASSCPEAFSLNLSARLACAQASEASARSATANGSYYAAASLSFQAAIDAHYVRDAKRLEDAGATRAELDARLADDNATLNDARRQIEGFAIRDTGLFESAGAAQVRLIEAEGRMDEALAAARNATTLADAEQAVYQAAYAAERAQTATWWLRLGQGFPKGSPIDEAGLEGLARDEITAAREEIAYVEAVFGQANLQTTLTDARTTLDEAQRAYDDGLLAAAMLDALEAEVRASVILEIAGFQGNVPPEKMEAARLDAARAIQTARARGVEPFLAESEYEFGQTLPDAGERLTFFAQARVSANLAGLPGAFGNAPDRVQTRFQGFPQAYAPPSWIVGAFAVGMALGAGLGLAAILPRKEDEDDWRRDLEPRAPPEPTDERAPPW